jgi:hypothetical protein
MIRDRILHIAANYLSVDYLTPAIPPDDKKSMSRGFRHPQIGQMILPIGYRNKLLKNPKCVAAFHALDYRTHDEYSLFTDIRLDKVRLDATSAPAFCWPRDHDFSVSITSDFCRSDIILRVSIYVVSKPSQLKSHARC